MEYVGFEYLNVVDDRIFLMLFRNFRGFDLINCCEVIDEDFVSFLFMYGNRLESLMLRYNCVLLFLWFMILGKVCLRLKWVVMDYKIGV